MGVDLAWVHAGEPLSGLNEDGRLDLDELGRVAEEGRRQRAVDLGASASDDHVATEVQRWVDDLAAPWIRSHRLALALAGALALATAIGATAAADNASAAPVTLSVEIRNAPLPGRSASGPVVSEDGLLSVAYLARATRPGERVQLLRIEGPGLGASEAAGVVDDESLSLLTVSAPVDCSDPSLSDATPTSYELVARSVDASGAAVIGTVPLVMPLEAPAAGAGRRPVTRLNQAVELWCLAFVAPSAVQASVVALAPIAGTSEAELTLDLRNASVLALALRAEDVAVGRFHAELSPAVALDPGSSARVTAHVAWTGCDGQANLPALRALENPQPADDRGPGVALRLTLGDRSIVASYPLLGVERLVMADTCS